MRHSTLWASATSYRGSPNRTPTPPRWRTDTAPIPPLSIGQTGLSVPFRQAAFDHVNRLALLGGRVLDSADLAGGFEFGGECIPLVNPQRGIFKPRQMDTSS